MIKPGFNVFFALFLIRQLLGWIFFWQGHAKVFEWGFVGLYKSTFSAYKELLPQIVIWFTMYFTSFAELIGGLFLILGIFRNKTLYVLGIVLIVVTFGHGLQSGIWDLSHVMYRAILLFPLLLLPIEWDKWQVGNIITEWKRRRG